MKCHLHPNQEAIGACTSCGKTVCHQCAVEVSGRLVCRPCLSSGNVHPGSLSRGQKDRSLALILEILPGLFGFLGFGWIYLGQTEKGVTFLIGYLVWAVAAGVLMAITAGFACIFVAPINIGVIAMSASQLNRFMDGNPQLF
jgi:hypothetical protein